MTDKRIGKFASNPVLPDGGCSLDHFLKFLAREWMSHIVWTLAREEAMRFSALRRALPGAVSARVLSARLKELEALGFVMRADKRKLPLHVEYSLTEAGRRLDTELRRNEELANRLRRSAVGKSSNQTHKPNR